MHCLSNKKECEVALLSSDDFHYGKVIQKLAKKDLVKLIHVRMCKREIRSLNELNIQCPSPYTQYHESFTIFFFSIFI